MGPRQFTTIRRETSQTIEAFLEGDSHRSFQALAVHDEKFEVGKTQSAGGKNNIIPRRMIKGRPGHNPHMGYLFLIRTIAIHGINLGRHSVRSKSAPSDLLAVRTVEWS